MNMAVEQEAARPIARMRRTLLGVVPLESPLYRLHPVTRLFSLVLLAVGPLFIDIPELNVLWFIFILVLMKYGKVNISGLKIYLPLVFTVAIFMFSVAIIFPGKDPSYIPFKFLGITMYYQRMFWTVVSYLRLMAMLFGTIQYFSTNRERDTLVALRALKVPFAVTYFVSLSLRAADMFMQDLRTIREAERARGLDESSLSLRDRAKLYAMYMIPLFTLAIRRADEISNALFARGYTYSGKVLGGGRRVDYIMSQYEFKPLDTFLCALQVLIFVGIAFLQFRYGLFRIDNSPLNHYLFALASQRG